ncbi:hypothetical protein [Halorarum salinum]|uniref:Uncharacterized protein n=1 Tax=Halorarum salinum TaxID=2743089 RepID=A0A7D5QEV8_9EURY|nr:hypothetical protein [Halobaculum salinum]QLG63041.1 hypothetical protein HUG12_15395 [Halobaculum salinum]
MDTAVRAASGGSPSTRWSAYAGLYTFVCGTAIAFLLSDVLVPFGAVIGLPTRFPMVTLASPALVVGTAVWWTLVERRDSYTYPYGGVFGSVTALLTGCLWVVGFASVWGVEMLTAGMVPVLVAFVLGAAATAGLLAGLPLMYARCRLGDRPSRGTSGSRSRHG